MTKQIYEEYWKITNAFTNYNGKGFLNTLSAIIEFIDEHKEESFSKYAVLQNEVARKLRISYPSVRKAINQMVKFGFIEPYLTSYHKDAKKYLEAKTNRRRKSLLSKIVYSNSKLNSSVRNLDNHSAINFLIKTLEEVGKLTVDNIKGLMITELDKYPKGYLTGVELNQMTEYAKEIEFDKRKRNQIRYLCNLLNKLDDIIFIKNKLYFEDDAKDILGEELRVSVSKKRDSYLHLLYKNQLKEECFNIHQGGAKCMLEKLRYPVLIASHIKPFIECDDNDAYNPNNGLLLSRTVDSLFDLKYISFNDDGSIIFSNQLSQDVIDFWGDYTLDPSFLNDERKAFLSYHRTLLKQ